MSTLVCSSKEEHIQHQQSHLHADLDIQSSLEDDSLPSTPRAAAHYRGGTFRTLSNPQCGVSAKVLQNQDSKHSTPGRSFHSEFSPAKSITSINSHASPRASNFRASPLQQRPRFTLSSLLAASVKGRRILNHHPPAKNNLRGFRLKHLLVLCFVLFVFALSAVPFIGLHFVWMVRHDPQDIAPHLIQASVVPEKMELEKQITFSSNQQSLDGHQRKKINRAVLERAVDPFISGEEQDEAARSDSGAIHQTKVFAELDTSLPFIHILNTRFMQHQGNLTHLAEARLELFKTFCLPTIVQQTIQLEADQRYRNNVPLKQVTSYPYLWIIKTDPNLDYDIRQKLIELLKPHPNFFLIGSNNNFAASYGTGIEPGSWRGGHAGIDALNAKNVMYTGVREMIEIAHDLRNSKITVETRVDADDGLPLDYLEAVQRRAVRYLSTREDQHYHTLQTAPRFQPNVQPDIGADDDDHVTNPDKLEEILHKYQDSIKAKWMFWCIPHSISWHPTVLEDGFSPHSEVLANDSGRLVLDTNKGHRICMTPGLTVGMSVGTNDTKVPVESHYDILHLFERHQFKSNYNCGISQSAKPCVDVLEHKRAIRSRTPTSAGLKGVGIERKEKNETDIQMQWDYIGAVFGIPRQTATATNFYLKEHLVGILEDNLRGQCTYGHSCKYKARIHLEQMILAAKSNDPMYHEEVAHLLQHHSA